MKSTGNWLIENKIMTKRFSIILLFSLFALNASLHAQPTLKTTVGKHFLIGAAVTADQVWGRDSIGARVAGDNFNAVVAENCMKGEKIHPAKDTYYWADADRTVEFAEKNDMAVTGHVLVWHSQPPAWMFTDDNGNSVSRDELIDRMYHHITTVVSHFKGKIRGWDVVNEAFNDDGTYRESPYYKIIGKEYIPLAFRFAHAADPDAELYYNDYSLSLPAKREAVCRLIRELKSEGLRVDAVGMQSHNGTDYPNLDDYEASIKAFIGEGVKIHITELDLNMLPYPKDISGAEISQQAGYAKAMDPYRNGLTREAQKKFDERYLAFFSLYKKYEEHIGRVTLWGVTDATSWLNDWPIPGRVNYPLLFDRQGKAKPVVRKIEKMFE